MKLESIIITISLSFLFITNTKCQVIIIPDATNPAKKYEFKLNLYGSSSLEVENLNSSTFIGYQTGAFNGQDSTNNFHGTFNTGIGYHALHNNTNGYYNTAIASNALQANTTGQKNTALGDRSLFTNTIGSVNCAIGAGALMNNISGNFNVAAGNGALGSNTVGYSNVAFGTSALGLMTIGNEQTAVGVGAMSGLIQGGKSVAVGRSAFGNSNQAYESVAIGYRAGWLDTLSTNNTFLGYEAGAGGTSAAHYHQKSDNVMIGYQSGRDAHGDGNVFIGNQSGFSEVGDNKLYIENSAADSTSALIYGDFDNDFLQFNAGLTIVKNSVTGDPQLNLKEDNAGFARLQFSNTSGKQITLAAIPNTNTSLSELNVFIEDAGNVMTIQGDQRVGINETAPNQTLDVNAAVGDSPLRVRTGSTEHISVNNTGVTTINKTLLVEGDVPSGFATEINNNAPGSKFNDGLAIQINLLAGGPESDNQFISFKDGTGTDLASIRGDGSGNLDFFQVSDRRHKQNINTFHGGLKIIDQIDAYNYEMKSAPGKKQIGFIAQELYKTFPQIVSGTPETTTFEEPMMVDYAGITPVLVSAIKELSAKNGELSKELGTMYEIIGELKAQLNVQQTQLDSQASVEE